MAEFSQLILTEDGKALLANVLAGAAAMEFTRVCASDAEYAPDALKTLRALSGVRQESAVSRVARADGDSVQVEAAFTNAGLGEGYFIRTLGLYARGASGAEVLYAAARETGGGCYMPPEGGASVSGVYVQLVTAVQNTENVSMTVAGGAAATVSDLRALRLTVTDHEQASLYSEAGVHGIRCAEGGLQVAAPDGAGGVAWRSAGGANTVRVTFDASFAGCAYTVTDGLDTQTGIVPKSLAVCAAMRRCDAVCTVTCTAADGTAYTAGAALGPYYGQYSVHLGAFDAALRVTAAPGAVVTAARDDGASCAAAADGAGIAVVHVHEPGVYFVTARLGGAYFESASVAVTQPAQYAARLGSIALTVESTPGAALTLTGGASLPRTCTRVSTGRDTFYLPAAGTWLCTAELNGARHSETAVCERCGQYSVTVEPGGVYGARWDGTASTRWTRTGDAAALADPVPYVAGASDYGSPFDSLMPWAGMTVSERAGGTMVAVPKFWYRLTATEGGGVSVEIAQRATEGFVPSPAHMDRGDGKGERDVVYVGRYHCAGGGASVSGEEPLRTQTRATFRTTVHSLGDTVWQEDLALRFTLWLLYIVEFADWDSQKRIGFGCGDGSWLAKMGYTDAMPYHTGTMLESRETYGFGTQYRGIEGLWENTYEWLDGCYNNAEGLCVILNPAQCSDAENGVCAGKPAAGFASAFTVSDTGGFPLLISTKAEGAESTYSCDKWWYDASLACVCAGGCYQKKNGNYGLMYGNTVRTSYRDNFTGGRPQELP